MRKKATHLKEIAYELGLSVNTVSRALRDCYDISDKTKKRVVEKAIEMGYIPNSVSQFIKNGSTKLFAFVVNNLKNMYFFNAFDMFAKALKNINTSFTLIYTDKPMVDVSILKQCISQRVDAIICFCRPDEETVKLAQFNQIPIIFLGQERTNKELSTIYCDNEHGGILAANYLLNYHSGSKIVYYGLPDYYDSEIRFQSFSNAIKKASPDTEVLFLNNSTSSKDLVKVIQDGFLNIFCFNDEEAYDLLDKLNSEIPNVRRIYPKLHIIGFDNLSCKIKGLVDITSINFDVNKIIEETLKYIKNYDNGMTNPIKVCIPVSLHIRSIY